MAVATTSAVQVIALPSYAKINLGLRVLGKRPDGYHSIETVFQQISLHDLITISLRPPASATPRFSLHSTDATLPTDASNLASKAAALFLRHVEASFDVDLVLEKHIPIGAGLGGGSSNAATVLLGLNQMLGRPCSVATLRTLGRELGADVPFFIEGGLAAAGGIGDELQPLARQLKMTILLVVPSIHISTKWAYTNLNFRLTNKSGNITLSCFIETDDLRWENWQTTVHNDFEPLVFGNYSSLKSIKDKLYALGAGFASLSGSGSALFGLFTSDEEARHGVEFFQPNHFTFLAAPIRFGYHEIGQSAEE